VITQAQFMKIFPDAKEPHVWVAALNKLLPVFDIENIPAFLAQCGHESQGFTRMVENLNYSAAALLATWPRRFTPETAQKYARKPVEIANKVYSGRLGNGDEASGDGWNYRGRGVIQITGKANYQEFARELNKTLEEVVIYLETKEGAVDSACWYWQTRNLNAVAGDIEKLTKAINGGLNGLADRRAYFAKISEVMA